MVKPADRSLDILQFGDMAWLWPLELKGQIF